MISISLARPSFWNRLPIVARRMLFVGAVAVVLSVSMLTSVALGLPSIGFGEFGNEALVLVAVSVGVKLPMLQIFRLFDVSLRYVSIRDLVMMVVALGVGTAVIVVVAILGDAMGTNTAYAVQWVLLDYQLNLMLVGSLFVARRVVGEWRRSRARRTGTVILIAGAGSAADQLVHLIEETKDPIRRIAGFLDDDPMKAGSTIRGIPVRGKLSDIKKVAQRTGALELWIAMPSVRRQVIQDAARLAREAGLDVKIVPSLDALLTGKISLADVRNVDLEDLLGREPVRVESGKVAAFLRGRRVLVTGAAGSIGSELCRQIARFEPRNLILLDQDETGVFNVASSLAVAHPELDSLGIIADVCDATRIQGIFQVQRPDVVFHAAAYKHVPLMEQYPAEAIKTNVLGTEIVAKAAVAAGTQDFVMISTDKAVNPTSVMGATKRAAESIVCELSAQSQTKFVAVRFGNVLGSRGSVIPTFQEQIKRGGPITITHPDMKRYFMTTNEAVLLVLQAACDGRSGQVLVLDMGEPVKIVDLARNLIELSGLVPEHDIPIAFTGLRPGEKLFEDILTAEEGTIATRHDRIFVANVSGVVQGADLERCLGSLRDALEGSAESESLKTLLSKVVPTYTPYEAPALIKEGVATPSRSAVGSVRS